MTGRDVEVQVAQFKSFLATKRIMLTDQIEHKKLRGLTYAAYACSLRACHRFALV